MQSQMKDFSLSPMGKPIIEDVPKVGDRSLSLMDPSTNGHWLDVYALDMIAQQDGKPNEGGEVRCDDEKRELPVRPRECRMAAVGCMVV